MNAKNTPADNQVPAKFGPLLRLVRPRQWVKNAFVLAPLLFSGRFTEPAAIVAALLATFLFCLAASSVYIINDILDREADRQHPTKCKRPLASGTVSLPDALVLLVVLYGLILLGGLMAPRVVLVIIGYLVLNLAYATRLKHMAVIDIFTVAAGFVLRVWAGALALQVPVSSWMLITTFSLALYLTAVKRRQELVSSGSDCRQVLQKYSLELIERYAQLSAAAALLLYCIFVMSARPQLVISIPLVMFGLFRYWYLVDGGDGESPTEAVLGDLPLLLTVALWALACGYELWPPGL